MKQLKTNLNSRTAFTYKSNKNLGNFRPSDPTATTTSVLTATSTASGALLKG